MSIFPTALSHKITSALTNTAISLVLVPYMALADETQAEPILVPDVIDSHHLIAGSILDELGIPYQVDIQQDVCTASPDKSVYETSPKVGEPLDSENPLVILKVVGSASVVNVPDITRKSFSDATQTLENLGLVFHDGGQRMWTDNWYDWCGRFTDVVVSSDVREQIPSPGGALRCGDIVTGFRHWQGRWISQRAPNGQCK